jgi:hypothetical protein
MTRVTNENLKVIKDAQKRAKALLRELKVGDPLEHGYGVCRELAGLLIRAKVNPAVGRDGAQP